MMDPTPSTGAMVVVVILAIVGGLYVAGDVIGYLLEHLQWVG